jgi:tetratricopeptide (TPR) repeat protein
MSRISFTKVNHHIPETFFVGLGMLCMVMFLAVDGAQAQATKSEKEVVDQEEKTMDLLSRIDVFTEEDERLKMDSARAHYNMGNVYYQKGEYEVAAREFYQAVILMPNDPDVHYNLAYVSSEHLKDFETARKHYKMYLYLKPDAKDLHYVRKKILEAELKLRGKIDSPVEEY